MNWFVCKLEATEVVQTAKDSLKTQWRNALRMIGLIISGQLFDKASHFLTASGDRVIREDIITFMPHTCVLSSGAPNVNFLKISVRKTIWDLEFSDHLL